MRHIFRCPGAARLPRVQALQKIVGRVISYCLGACRLRNAHLLQLRVAHRRMLLAVLRIGKRPLETLEEFVRRRHRVVRTFRERARAQSWDHHAVSLMWSWAGHVARNENGIASLCVAWRGSEWRAERRAASQRGRLFPGRGRYCFYRWEQLFTLYYRESNTTWREAAQDREAWLASTAHFVRWRCVQRRLA